jgi:hypothetical protein
MKVEFQDLEDRSNPHNGEGFTSVAQVVGLLNELRYSRPPFMCELRGDNGITLTVGLGIDIGCVQYAPSDGNPPYMMAVSPPEVKPYAGEMEFVVGGTATPIDGRYYLPFQNIEQIIAYFMETGGRSPTVAWEEF